MRTLDRSRWLLVESKEAIELVQLELQRQGIQYAKQTGLLTTILFNLSQPYSNGCQDFDKIIFRRTVK